MRISKKVERVIYHTRKWVWFSTLAGTISLVVLAGIAQYWLPGLLEDKQQVEQYLSGISQQKITVGSLYTQWDGMHPGVRALDIKIGDDGSGHAALSLKEVRLSLSFRTLWERKPVLYRLVLVRPELEFRRDTNGNIAVSGIRTRERQTSPLPGNDRRPGAAAVDWLFLQGNIEIQNGLIEWIDQRPHTPESAKMENVHLSLINSGQRHQLSASASLPQDICISCSLSMDIEGNPITGTDWGGFINVNAIGLSLRNPLTVIRERLPTGLGGQVDLVLRSQWVQGRPRLANGRISGDTLRIPVGNSGKMFDVEKVITRIKWRERNNYWSLDADIPFVLINKEPWLPGKLIVSRYAGGTHVYLRHLNIRRATGLAGEFEMPAKQRELLASLNPGGDIDDLEVDYKDAGQEGDRVRVKGSLRNFNSEPYRKIPGVKGLSATFDTTENSGEVFLNSRRSQFNSTYVFREPIPVHRAKARINWQRKQDLFEVIVRNIQIVGRDLSARGGLVFRLPKDRKVSPYLDMRIDFFQGTVARKSIYLPVNVMKKPLVDWIDRSVISGKLTDGYLIYKGNTREFPFLENNGLFEVAANVEGGKLQYLPAWKPITNANMHLLFHGSSMLITAGSGRIEGVEVGAVVASKENLKDRQESIHITGSAFGPVAASLAVLRNAVTNGQTGNWTGFVESDFIATGDGQLNLNIDIPVSHQIPFRMSGDYRFLGADVTLPVGGIPVTQLRGNIGFNESRITEGKLEGTSLGGPVNISVTGRPAQPTPVTHFVMAGQMRPAGLAAEYGQWIGHNFNGNVPWSGEVEFRNGLPNVSFQADMRSVKTSLPPPLAQFSGLDEKFMLESASSEHKRHIIKFSLGSRLTGVLDFIQSGKRWGFAEGKLLVGEGIAELSGNRGMHLEFRGDNLPAEDWIKVLYGNTGGQPMPQFIQRVTGRFQSVEALHRRLGPVSLSAVRESSDQWRGAIDGDNFLGSFRLGTQSGSALVELDLEKLILPEAEQEEGEATADSEPVDPRSFPSVRIASKKFVFGTMNLGKLDFTADHTRLGWEINRLQLTRPEMSLFADGAWFRIAGNYVTKAKMKLVTSDLGTTAAALGSPGQITGGSMNLDLDLGWRQDSRNKGLKNLNGEISLQVKNGVLNKVDSGAAKVAGAFSLSSLGRYLSLDFSSAFGKGFAFDEMHGKVQIRQGEATTQGFTLKAPAASVLASGRIGLHKKDIDINADIYPNVKGGVTLATGSLFGLQAAAWVFALQQIFSSKIEEGTRISYHIYGSLGKPTVSKVVSTAQTGSRPSN